jgi:phosphatidylglycerophosphate synthase
MSSVDSIVILADESANWKIAGLRQLDRLALAFTELGRAVDLFVFWKPYLPASRGALPVDSRIARVRSMQPTESPEPGARVLSTHVFVGRNEIGAILETMPVTMPDHSAVDPAQAWQQLFEQSKQACRALGENPRRFIANPADIAECELHFLRRAGKPQDGLVSRFLNRPISRRITRRLLKFPITPTAWTLSILILPLISCALLVRGGYIDILIGTLIYQLYSILGECDGEIARAKYQESKAGRRIDDFCDLVGGLFFVIGLGLGLYHSAPVGSTAWLYAPEAILCAALIVTNKFLLRSAKRKTTLKSRVLSQAMLVQITKRDVAILFFVLLALVGLPQWILHLWLAVALVDVVLAGTAPLKR